MITFPYFDDLKIDYLTFLMQWSSVLTYDVWIMKWQISMCPVRWFISKLR